MRWWSGLCTFWRAPVGNPWAPETDGLAPPAPQLLTREQPQPPRAPETFTMARRQGERPKILTARDRQ